MITGKVKYHNIMKHSIYPLYEKFDYSKVKQGASFGKISSINTPIKAIQIVELKKNNAGYRFFVEFEDGDNNTYTSDGHYDRNSTDDQRLDLVMFPEIEYKVIYKDGSDLDVAASYWVKEFNYNALMNQYSHQIDFIIKRINGKIELYEVHI